MQKLMPAKREKKRERELGGGTTFEMQAWLTFASRNRDLSLHQEVSSDFFQVMSWMLPKDDSRGVDDSPGIKSTSPQLKK